MVVRQMRELTTRMLSPGYQARELTFLSAQCGVPVGMRATALSIKDPETEVEKLQKL